MGLKCLLGHDFGDPEVERERQEEGNEVVVTLREVKTCRRCGEQRVVSENKEVTSVEQLSAAAEAGSSGELDEAPTERVDQDEPVGAEVDESIPESEEQTIGETTPEELPEEDAEILTSSSPDVGSGPVEDDPSTAGESEASRPADESGATWPSGEDGTAGPPGETSPEEEPIDRIPEDDPAGEPEDDGLILSADEEEAEQPERAPGEWPDREASRDAEAEPHTPWPEQEPEPTDEPIDSEEPPRQEQPREAVAAEETGAGFTRAREATPPDQPADDVPTEFYCPECGISQRAGLSSMRSGDICPECHRGYIAERPL